MPPSREVVPVFVAAMVWLIRVLIIGTFSVAGDRLFSTGQRVGLQPALLRPLRRPPAGSGSALRSASRPCRAPGFLILPVGSEARPRPRPYDRMEPTYQNVALDASASEPGLERRLQ